jgi:N6-adenosine-specific RNA methylase IME4
MHYLNFDDIPRGVFSIISADPPWRFVTYSAKGKLKKSAELHYPTMTLDDIAALPVAEIAAPDCGLFLWATAPMLQEALAMMNAWGFTYKSHGVWGKLTRHGKIAFGTGYRLRNSHEIWLVGVRGNPKNTKSERSLILSPVRAHSQKPDEAAELMERWLPDARRIDLFGGRTTRQSWDSYGDQPGIFDQDKVA